MFTSKSDIKHVRHFVLNLARPWIVCTEPSISWMYLCTCVEEDSMHRPLYA